MVTSQVSDQILRAEMRGAHRTSECYLPGVPTHGSEHPLAAFFLADSVQVSHAVRHVSVRISPAVLVAGTFPVWKPVTLGHLGMSRNQVFF